MLYCSVFHVGSWRIDVAARSATNGLVESKLSPRAVRVLGALAQAQGDVVSRDELLTHGWPNVTVSDESLTQVITELRRTFRRDGSGQAVIQTVAKAGYRVAAPVLMEADPDQFPSTQSSGFDFEAYRLCLDARMVLSRSGPGSTERAEMLAREAAERAPDFALAQAEHAIMLVQRHLYRQGGFDGLLEALNRAQTAVRLRSDLSTAHSALGYTFGALNRWAEAKQSFEHALGCDQNDADAHYLAARTLFASRDYAGATTMAERAAALDVENYRPVYLAARAAAAVDPMRARRLGELTLKRVRTRLEIDPLEPRAVNTLGPLMAHLGEHDVAASTLEAESSIGSPMEFYDVVARALIGDVPGAIRTLEAVVDRGWCHPAWLAAEPALASLNSERAYRRIASRLGAA